MTAEAFANGVATVETAEGPAERSLAELALCTTVSMEDLLVEQAPPAGADGERTLLCTADGAEVPVRLEGAAAEALAGESPAGRLIDVRGVVERYDGDYQILVLTTEGITIH